MNRGRRGQDVLCRIWRENDRLWNAMVWRHHICTDGQNLSVLSVASSAVLPGVTLRVGMLAKIIFQVLCKWGRVAGYLTTLNAVPNGDTLRLWLWGGRLWSGRGAHRVGHDDSGRRRGGRKGEGGRGRRKGERKEREGTRGKGYLDVCDEGQTLTGACASVGVVLRVVFYFFLLGAVV